MLRLLLLVGCTSPQADTGDSGPPAEPQISVNDAWGTAALTFSLTRVGGTTGFSLGMAQTAKGADGWYGEDCLADHVCHHLDGTSGTLTYVTDPSQVVAGQTTYFNDTESDGITYEVAIDGGACYVLGNQPSYYDALGCLTLQ